MQVFFVSNAVYHPQFRFLVSKYNSLLDVGNLLPLSILNDLPVFQVWRWHFLWIGRSSPSLVFWLLFHAIDLDQCVFVCAPVVSGKNRKLCALISPVFHLSEQFNRVFKGTPADMMTGDKLCFRFLSNQNPLRTQLIRVIGLQIFGLFL